MKDTGRFIRLLQVFIICLFLNGALMGLGGGIVRAEDKSAAQQNNEQLPLLQPDSPSYRTPRAGEGFRIKVFGKEVTVQPRDRRSVSDIDLGFAFYKPLPQNHQIVPFGDLYFWRHPDDRTLLRADVVGVYDDIFFSRSPSYLEPFEWVLTFQNFTVPFAQMELVDGRSVKKQELLWGYVRPGFGLGYRRQVAPGHQDNMFAVDLTFEPGFFFFDDGSKTANNFVVPHDTFEFREHLQVRWDALERNTLSLPHQGFATGVDLVNANRTNWRDWGTDGSQSADEGRHYRLFNGYFMAAGGVPFLNSDRHRLIGSLNGGIGSDVDRFSAPRVGGGVLPMGEEYGSTWRPILPGSVIQEFFPKHYIVAVGEYRWEALFFTYLSLDASVGWLDRLRKSGTETISKNDVLSSLGARLTTGFFFSSRLQLAYNYNFSDIREGHHGGHEVVLFLSRSL